MPGLSQLKKFNSEILTLGNEPELRAKRGEKAVTVAIPKNLKDINDSDDFVMGMPEPVNNFKKTENKIEEKEDFSDITGFSSDNNSSNAVVEETAPAIDLNLSSLMAPVENADGDEPDLSMFMEPVQEEVQEEEVVEEEVSIADLSLDDLLSGSGFDGSEGTDDSSLDEEVEILDEDTETFAEGSEPVPAGDFEETGDNLTENLELIEEPESLENDIVENNKTSNNDLPEDIFQAIAMEENSGTDAVEEIAELDSTDFLPGESFSLEDFPEIENSDSSSAENFDLPVEDISSPDTGSSSTDNFDLPVEDISSPDTGSSSTENFDLPLEDISSPDTGSSSAENFDLPVEDISSPDTGSSSTENFDLPLESAPDDLFGAFENIDAPSEINTGDLNIGDIDNFNAPDGLFNSSDIEQNDNFGMDSISVENSALQDNSEVLTEDLVSEAEKNEDFKTSDFAQETAELDSPFENSSLSLPDIDESINTENAMEISPEMEVPSENNFGQSGEVEGDFPENFDFNIDSNADDDLNTNFDSFEENVSPEIFDTSQMEGVSFDFPETDAQLAGGFELSNSQDVLSEVSDFSIPGFSDVQIADEKREDKVSENDQNDNKGLDDEDVDEELPPNTLSDRQYKKFLKNLSEYPLNVRIAVEDLITKNEFTDDAEFEIVTKILKKVPARSLASELEKMLDMAIPVPRDYERRTSEEYEAYKNSFQYQLLNKIIPGAIITVASLIACFGIFIFSKNFIYKPLKANSLYKQGYVLLQNDDFPQSEIKFNEAKKYKLKKKWFFKYAQGYCNHKQYIRSEKMYESILSYFDHDKAAGLEYAKMEMDELSNYEKCENVLRREVLDYHINDPDALLLMGDNFLEWATEKDEAKFKDAFATYSNLNQLYGVKNSKIYNSRFMRYYVRTDNLKEVLSLKNIFIDEEKSLNSADWTELSGYLLEKLYGKIPPKEEYLRTKIEDVKDMLLFAVKADETNPVALYNLSKYFIYTNNKETISALQNTIKAFNNANKLKKRDIYKFIDSYRLYGEEYMDVQEYLKAQEIFTNGIMLFQKENENSGFEGDSKVGKLYQDIADIQYFISGDYDSALINYKNAVENKNDIPEIRYKIGYINYGKQNYSEAFGSFMKAGEENGDDYNLLLSIANTLSLKDDNFASQGYYEKLLEKLKTEIDNNGIMYIQQKKENAKIMDVYMKATNNLGVTLFRLAKRTGSSLLNAKAMVQFQESLRVWDLFTRNQKTMERLEGGNLAEQNLKYASHPFPDFEPAIYTEISRNMFEEEALK